MQIIKPIIRWVTSLFIAACIAGLSFYVLAILFSAEARGNAGITFSPIGMLYLLSALVFSALFYGAIIFVFSFLPALLVSGIWELTGRRPSYTLYSFAGVVTAVLTTGYLTLSNASYDITDAWLEWLADDWVLTVNIAPSGFVGGIIMAWLRMKAYRKA